MSPERLHSLGKLIQRLDHTPLYLGGGPVEPLEVTIITECRCRETYVYHDKAVGFIISERALCVYHQPRVTPYNDNHR